LLLPQRLFSPLLQLHALLIHARFALRLHQQRLPQ
jgi:hypothetical protein